ncbi:MAG TPA: helix-turn-helix domain-containing protein [Patescibacteria group bacterium]|nr:helix-turn-helix domain-containing protein [Patescibacteria group bacterium]
MEEKLKILGLTPNEARVYIALCKYEQAVVHTIAREAGVNRTTAYGVLHKLLHKGVVAEKTLNNVKYFIAVDIDMLFERVSREYEDLRESVPGIRGLQRFYTDRPKIHFFHGLEAVKSLYDDTLTADKEILGYVNATYGLKAFYDFQFNDYIPKRVKKNILYRGLYVKDDQADGLIQQSKTMLREVRFLPQEKFFINHEINMYNDKIMYIFFKKKLIYGALIQDKDLVRTERSIFEILWEYSSQFLQTTS